MSTVTTLTSWGMVLAAAGFLGWLGLPSQPPVDASWPQPGPEARGMMATELARGVSTAWQNNQKQLAWEQAEILLAWYPEQPYTPRLKASQARLKQAADQETWSKRWAYQTLEGGNWGRLAQAQVNSDPLSFSPDLPVSSLIVRTGSLAQYNAVFLVPGGNIPASCREPAGCVVQVNHGAEQTPLRLVPVKDGWFRFTDTQRVLGWLQAGQALSVTWSEAEPLRFETRGLDLQRMGLLSTVPA